MVSVKIKDKIIKVSVNLLITSIIGISIYFFARALYNAFNLKTGYTCKDNKCTESTVTNPDFATEADCKKECEYNYYCNRGDNKHETVAGKCELDLTRTKSPSYSTKNKCDTECSKVAKQYWKCKEDTETKTCISTYSFDKPIEYPYVSQDACVEAGCSNPSPAKGTCCPGGFGNDPDNCLGKSKDSCSTDECIWKEEDTSCTMYRCTDETEKTCTEIKKDFQSTDYTNKPTCETNCKPSPTPPPTPPPPFYRCIADKSDDAKCVIVRNETKGKSDFDSLLSCQKNCQPQNPAAKGRCLATAGTSTQTAWNGLCLAKRGVVGGCGVMDKKGYLDATCVPTKYKDQTVVDCKAGNFWGTSYNDKIDHSINSYCDNFSKEQAECTNDFIDGKASYDKKDPPKSNDTSWLHSPTIVDLISKGYTPCEWHTPAGLCEGENIGNDCSIKTNEEDCNNSFITSNNFYNNICYWNGESCEPSLQCQPKLLCGNGKGEDRGKIKNAITCSEQKKDDCYKHFEFDEDENKGYQCQYNEDDEQKCSRGIECEINTS